jgi:hypothetical protein
MEIDIGEDAVVPLDGERVLADEEMLVPGKADHEIPRGDADRPLIGVDPHDRRIELRARPRVPAGMKRRIEMQAMLGDDDLGDLHACSPAACARSAIMYGPASPWYTVARHIPAGRY